MLNNLFLNCWSHLIINQMEPEGSRKRTDKTEETFQHQHLCCRCHFDWIVPLKSKITKASSSGATVYILNSVLESSCQLTLLSNVAEKWPESEDIKASLTQFHDFFL